MQYLWNSRENLCPFGCYKDKNDMLHYYRCDGYKEFIKGNDYNQEKQ